MLTIRSPLTKVRLSPTERTLADASAIRTVHDLVQIDPHLAQVLNEQDAVTWKRLVKRAAAIAARLGWAPESYDDEVLQTAFAGFELKTRTRKVLWRLGVRKPRDLVPLDLSREPCIRGCGHETHAALLALQKKLRRKYHWHRSDIRPRAFLHTHWGKKEGRHRRSAQQKPNSQ